MTKTIRIAILLSIGVILFIATLAVLPALKPVPRSAAFNAQVSVAEDAIERFRLASGFAETLATLEARRELDALQRMADTPIEENVVAVMNSYWFAVQLYRIEPSRANLQTLRRAAQDAWTVRFQL